MSDRTHPDSGPVTPGEAGFTAADMATAAAQGFRDGVASLAASAGSEPVAWQYRSVRDKGLWFDCTEERAKQRAAHPETWDVRYLYTHPSPPEGMVGGWMPIEPTLEMITDATRAYQQAAQSLGAFNAPWAAYRAMLAALPPAPSTEGEANGTQ